MSASRVGLIEGRAQRDQIVREGRGGTPKTLLQFAQLGDATLHPDRGGRHDGRRRDEPRAEPRQRIGDVRWHGRRPTGTSQPAGEAHG